MTDPTPDPRAWYDLANTDMTTTDIYTPVRCWVGVTARPGWITVRTVPRDRKPDPNTRTDHRSTR